MNRLRAYQTAAILLTLCFVLLLAPAAGAQGTGVIEGSIVNGGTGQPVGGLEVALDRYEGMTATQTMTAQADAQGRFRFENLPVGDTTVYFARVTYAGAEYPTDMLALTAAEATQTITLTVYDATDDGSGIGIERVHLIVQPSAAGVRVAEMVVVSNSGKGTFTGKPGASGMPFTLRFYLPAGATQLAFDDGGLGTRFMQLDDGFVDIKPVRPGVGVDQIIFSYVLPAQSGAWSLDYRLAYPAKTLNVLTSDGWEAMGANLTFIGEMGGSADQAPFLNYRVEGVAAEQVLKLGFAPGTSTGGATMGGSGEPTVSPESAQPTLLLLMAGVLVLLLAAAFSYPIWREHLPRAQGL